MNLKEMFWPRGCKDWWSKGDGFKPKKKHVKAVLKPVVHVALGKIKENLKRFQQSIDLTHTSKNH